MPMRFGSKPRHDPQTPGQHLGHMADFFWRRQSKPRPRIIRIKSRHSAKARGFTLLELLIAFSITAFIGISATAFLGTVIQGKEGVDRSSYRLAQLQRLGLLMGRDIEQIISRSVRGQYGALPSINNAVIADSLEFAFTRSGWALRKDFTDNPLEPFQRAQLQRVEYRLLSLDAEQCTRALPRLRLRLGLEEDEIPEGQCLVRSFWNVLDRLPDSEPFHQILLDQIDELGVRFLYTLSSPATATSPASAAPDLLESPEWPPDLSGSASAGSALLQAIEVRLQIPDLGEVRRLHLVPQVST